MKVYEKNNSIYFLTVGALVLLVGGIYFIKTNGNPQGMLRVLPYISVGLGCSIFGHGMGEILTRLAMKKNPVAAKRLEIDKKDERNLAIANQAKAKAYDMPQNKKEENSSFFNFIRKIYIVFITSITLSISFLVIQ